MLGELAEHRIRGEWFRPELAVRRLIDSLLDALGDGWDDREGFVA